MTATESNLIIVFKDQFFELPTHIRIAMIDTWFMEADSVNTTKFFPVRLTNGNIGLLFISDIWFTKFFRIGLFSSPDKVETKDFYTVNVEIHNQILEFIKNKCKIHISFDTINTIYYDYFLKL